MITPRLSEDIRDELLGYAAEIAEDIGLKVFELTVSHQRKGWQIRLTLDKLEGFVSVEDCASVSKRLDTRIELERLLPPDDYTLEVSSPGLDRPLRGEEDYRRFLGQLAKFTVRTSQGGHAVIGRIVSVGDGKIEVLSEDETIAVPISDIKEARLVPEGPGFNKSGDGRKKKRK